MRPALLALLLVAPTGFMRKTPHHTEEAAARRWKINTHVYAANQALDDAVPDGMVTIAPYGEFPVAASALRAIRAAPAAYRAGVLAPDLFPDMYVGGWFIHSDLSATPEQWTADNWMQYVWNKARGWTDAGERDKVLAFAYGFLTHGAGDVWAHTYVNKKADGAWVTFTGPSRSTAIKHVVLEGYVGAHTPDSKLSLDVWPRFVSNVLIKDPVARQHTRGAQHYQKWLEISDWLEPLIARAKQEMNQNISNDAPYWAKCAMNPVACAKKEQMETWRLDINRGLRAMVDSSESLGEKLMRGEPAEGGAAMSGWMIEWIPKMFGAHAIGEGGAALQQFLNWVGSAYAPISDAIKAETERAFKRRLADYYDLYQAAKDPSLLYGPARFSGRYQRPAQPGHGNPGGRRGFQPADLRTDLQHHHPLQAGPARRGRVERTRAPGRRYQTALPAGREYQRHARDVPLDDPELPVDGGDRRGRHQVRDLRPGKRGGAQENRPLRRPEWIRVLDPPGSP